MTGLVLALLAAGGYLYGTYVGCRQLEVRPVELAFADLPEALRRLPHRTDFRHSCRYY